MFKRKNEIDNIKAIGIVSVIYGHLFNNYVSHIIYLFHMPLFFFLAGYLIKPTDNFKQFLLKKTKHLLVPYISFLILIYLLFCLPPISELMELPIKDKFILLFLRPIFLRSFMGDRFPFGGYLAVFWFPICFFISQQIFNYCIIRFPKKLILIPIIGILLSILPQKVHLIWGISSLPMALVFLYFGNIFKAVDIKKHKSILILGFLAVVICSYLFTSNKLDMAKGEFGIPILTILSSLIFIVFIFFITENYLNLKIVNSVLGPIGRASMVIMYTHQTIQILLGNLIPFDYLRFLLTVLICLIINFLILKNEVLATFFLGKEPVNKISTKLNISNK